jgi:hypothetical protein
LERINFRTFLVLPNFYSGVAFPTLCETIYWVITMRRLTDAREAVDVLGGISAVCDLTGSLPKAVYHWTNVNSFPARHFELMRRALKRRGYGAPPGLWNQTIAKKAA